MQRIIQGSVSLLLWILCLYTQALAFDVENVDGYLMVKQFMVGVAVVPLLRRVGEQDTWGKPFPLTLHRGKYYLHAEQGKPFGIDFQVPENARFLFVTTIDGINIIGGHSDLPGYIVSAAKFPGENTVAGWRFDSATVHRFVFVDKEQSFAATPGVLDKQQEIGTIVVNVFAEQGARSMQQATRDSRGLGTGLGEHVKSAVAGGNFLKGEQVAQFVIHYLAPEQLSREEFPVE